MSTEEKIKLLEASVIDLSIELQKYKTTNKKNEEKANQYWKWYCEEKERSENKISVTKAEL